MSGFDVTRADARRSRALVVAATLLVSGGLLLALIAGETGRAPDAAAGAALAENAETPEIASGTDLTSAAELAAASARSTASSPPPTTQIDAPRAPQPAFIPPRRPLVLAAREEPAELHQIAFLECRDCAEPRHQRLVVPRGGTLAGLLDEAGADRYEAGRAIAALNGTFDVRRMRAGQAVSVFTEHRESGDMRLIGLSFRPEVERAITVALTFDGQYRARETQAEFRTETVMAAGEISSSLYADALAAGATDRVIVELAGVLAYAVDFQRSIYPGDDFAVLFERFVDAEGEVARTGEILYARYEGRGEPLEFYRFETPDGILGYYDPSGESAQRLLMRTPINGARLSSHFGRRRHPILGYTRNHNGTDFAAPTGTPILAAGNGVVERANRFGSFGNYIRIRHANGYETAYAHLNGFARGVRAGTRVRQGQVIGYVGTTGRSTGPHLHYEVHHNGRPVNPMQLNLPTGRRLTEEELPLFRAERDRIMALMANAPAADGSDEVLMADRAPATSSAREGTR